MIVHYKNYAKDATLTAQNIPTKQAVADLQDDHLSSTFTQDWSYVEEPFIHADLGGSRLVKSILFDNQGILEGVVATAYYSTDDSTWIEYGDMIRTETAYYVLGVATARYWKILFTDSTLESNELTLGTLFIGDYIVLSGISPSAKLDYSTTSSREMSISGQVYGDLGFNFFSASFDFPFVPETTWVRDGKQIATRKDLVEMFNTIGNSIPVWLFIWENSLEEFPPVYSVLNQSAINFTRNSTNLSYKTTLSFMEVK